MDSVIFKNVSQIPVDNIKELKVIPFYVDKGLNLFNRRVKEILWLEILFNDRIEWERFNDPIIKGAYKKACIWYWNFKSLLESSVKRKPLEFKKGEPDLKEYRKFVEVLNFVTT